MTKTELLAEILGEAREFESNDGSQLTESKQAIANGLAKDMKTLARVISNPVRDKGDIEITAVTRRGLVQAAGAIVALLTDDLTADRPEPEIEFPVMPNGIMAILFGVFVGVIAYLMVTWRHYRSVRGPSVLVLTIGWVFVVFVSIVFFNLAYTYLENMR